MYKIRRRVLSTYIIRHKMSDAAAAPGHRFVYPTPRRAVRVISVISVVLCDSENNTRRHDDK